MKIIEPSVSLLTEINETEVMKHLELCIRNCYKSEDKISENTSSAENMISKIIELDHTAMLEHFQITCQIVCDLGVYKDITRHRHASFAIESTRYCNYSKGKFGNELTFIKPVNMENREGNSIYETWLDCMQNIENAYIGMSEFGAKPDQLRMVLPHSISASVIMTANIRELRHILKLRCAKAAHPSVQQVMKMLLIQLYEELPLLFKDLYEKFIVNGE